jgi:hypothetical protein
MQSDLLGEDAGVSAVGGDVIVCTAAAALNIGDGVFLSAAFTVNKSAVAGNQVLVCGVVVGGVPRAVADGTLEVNQRSGDIGLQAAAAGERVLVCIGGVCVVIADAAITVGAQVKLSVTVSGRVTTATVSTDAGKILGKAFDAAAAAADKIRIIVSLG